MLEFRLNLGLFFPSHSFTKCVEGWECRALAEHIQDSFLCSAWHQVHAFNPSYLGGYPRHIVCQTTSQHIAGLSDTHLSSQQQWEP
jgi:hypothetical protein